MKDKIQALIDKYDLFVRNIEWHIKTNEPKDGELYACESIIRRYQEVLNDLKSLIK